MYDRDTVKVAPMSYGTAGTSTQVVGSTNTSNVYRLPRDPYTVAVGAYTTGTSIVGGSVVWQASDDNIVFTPVGTAAVLATAAAATGTAANVGFLTVNPSTALHPYGRAVVISTGTGWHTAYFSA